MEERREPRGRAAMDKRVLVVDDDRLIREMTRDALVQEGFRVATAATGREALSRLGDEGPFDLVITDLSMREMDGLELLERVKRASPRTEVIVLTGYASLESALQAMRLGAADYLRKPVSAPEITYCVKRTLLRRRLMDENEALRGCVQAFEAARALASCLESGDVLPLALDIVLRLTGRGRAVGRLVELPSRTGEGVELVGFPADSLAELRAQIEQRKALRSGRARAPGHRRAATRSRARSQRSGSTDAQLLRAADPPRGPRRRRDLDLLGRPAVRGRRAPARGAGGRAGGARADQRRALPAGAREGVHRRRHVALQRALPALRARPRGEPRRALAEPSCRCCSSISIASRP